MNGDSCRGSKSALEQTAEAVTDVGPGIGRTRVGKRPQLFGPGKKWLEHTKAPIFGHVPRPGGRARTLAKDTFGLVLGQLVEPV